MGLAASQARALLLVARKSDLEYRAQCISQRKMVLAQQTEELANKYSLAMNNRKMQFVYYLDGNQSNPKYENFSYYSLSATNPNFVGEYRVMNTRGEVVVASINDLPKSKVRVPIFAEVNGSTGELVQQTNVNYNPTNAKVDGSTKANLFIVGKDKDGNDAYIQVQNDKGEICNNAVTYAKDAEGNWVARHIFAENGTDANGNKQYSNTMLDAYKSSQVYEGVTSVSYVETSEPDATKAYQLVRYEEQEVPATPTGKDGEYYITDSNGNRTKCIICPDIAKDSYFQNGLRIGAFTLQQAETQSFTNDDGSTQVFTSWQTKPWQGIDVVFDSLNSEDDALAESMYEAKSAVIATQDKRLDMELKQIETQHQAVEKEEESVKTVIKNNIDKSFKIFAQG